MDDDRPRPKVQRLTILPFDEMGIAEIEAYADELRAEIARAQAAIERKRGHRGAADAVFGRRS